MTPLENLKAARELLQAEPSMTVTKALPAACERAGVPRTPNGYGRAYLALKAVMWGERSKIETVGSFEKHHGRDASVRALDTAISRMEDAQP